MSSRWGDEKTGFSGEVCQMKEYTYEERIAGRVLEDKAKTIEKKYFASWGYEDDV
jgi:hypothetical protein